MTYHSQQLLDFQNKLEKYIMNLWKIISGNDADVTAESVILDLAFYCKYLWMYRNNTE